MLLAHAITLAEARSYLAALANRAFTVDASAAYEYVLYRLGALHGAQVPAVGDIRLDDRQVLFTAAEARQVRQPGRARARPAESLRGIARAEGPCGE